MPNRSEERGFKTPVKITFVYVFAGILWVILSDKIIDILNLSAAITIHSSKGIFYVIVTAIKMSLLIHF